MTSHDALDKVSSRASDLTSKASDRANELGSKATDRASDLTSKASDRAGALSAKVQSRANDLTSKASDLGSKASDLSARAQEIAADNVLPVLHSAAATANDTVLPALHDTVLPRVQSAASAVADAGSELWDKLSESEQGQELARRAALVTSATRGETPRRWPLLVAGIVTGVAIGTLLGRKTAPTPPPAAVDPTAAA